MCCKCEQRKRKTILFPWFFDSLVLGLKFCQSCLQRVKNLVIILAERSKQVVPFVGVTLTHRCNCEDFCFAAFALKILLAFHNPRENLSLAFILSVPVDTVFAFLSQEKLPCKLPLASCNDYRLYSFCRSFSESSFILHTEYLFYPLKHTKQY